MDQAPTLAFHTSIQAGNVTGRDRYEPTLTDAAGNCTDIQIRDPEVLNRVPQAHDIVAIRAEIMSQQIAGDDWQAKLFARMADCIFTDVNALDNIELWARKIQKQSMCATDFEQSPMSGRIDPLVEDPKTTREVLLDYRAIAQVIRVLLAKEIVTIVDLTQLGVIEVDAGPSVVAAAAPNKAAIPRHRLTVSASCTLRVHS